MAIKNIVKGICNITRCKYDVYTKERTDELFKPKGEFAVFTGHLKIEGSNTVASAIHTLPDGFNMDNSVVLSVMSDNCENGVGVGLYWLNNKNPLWGEVEVSMTTNKISINFNKNSSINQVACIYNEIRYKVVVMKIS